MLKDISESKFNMWRAVVAMAHADGHVSSEEETFVLDYLNRLPFTDEQKNALRRELETEADLDPILKKITEPGDRAQVLHFARILCHRDGHLAPSEQQVLAKIHSHVLTRVDLGHAMKQAEAMDKLRQEEIEKLRFKGMFERFFDFVSGR